MADKEPLWNAMVRAPRAGADPVRGRVVVAFGDFVFGWDYDRSTSSFVVP